MSSAPTTRYEVSRTSRSATDVVGAGGGAGGVRGGAAAGEAVEFKSVTSVPRAGEQGLCPPVPR